MHLDWDIIKHFSQMDSPCFSYEEATCAFKKIKPTYISQVLSKMVQNKMLIRLRRGLYYIIPLDQSGEEYIPNWHLVAKYLMKGKNHYIGYYSAMQIHHLITQPSLTQIIVTDQQVKPSQVEIQGVRFQFIYHNKKRFFGVTNTWIDDFNKVKCSDIEKTLVDSFIAPHNSHGMVEIAKAVYDSKDKIKLDKLFAYFDRAGSKVAVRRYVFICDLLKINTAQHELELKKNRTGTILLLDTSMPSEGKIDTRYELKVNRDIQTIKTSINT